MNIKYTNLLTILAAVFLALPTTSFAQTQLSGTITGDTTLTKAESPYITHGLFVSSGSTLTIEAGVIVKFSGLASGIGVAGTLAVNGTNNDPVYFTSINDDIGGDTNGDGDTTHPSSGNWQHISMNDGSTGNFHYATIRYAGARPFMFTGIENNGGTVTLDHVTLSDNGADGYAQFAGSTLITDSEITRQNIGITLFDGTLSIHHSSLHDNTDYGVLNNGGTIIDATNNWWGDASGPYHPTLNPSATGNGVSDNVLVAPWLVAMPSDDIIPPTLTAIGQFKSDGSTSITSSHLTTEDTVILKGTPQGTEGQQLRLEAEILNIPFTEVRATSTLVTSGTETQIILTGLTNGTYHSRMRAVDEEGNASEWQEFPEMFEVKLVPLYTQVRSSYPSDDETRGWSGLIYAAGRADTPGSCGRTIAKCGCAITSSVMIARYYGATTTTSTTASIRDDVTPLTLDHWALATRAYDSAGNFDFAQLPRYAGYKVKFVKRSDVANNFSYLNTQLDRGRPQIAKASAGRGGTPKTAPAHFFVIDGRFNNGTYSVKDPAWYNTKSLTASTTSKALALRNYEGGFDGLRVFTQGTGTTSRALSFFLASPAELLITDSTGRRTGKDPLTNTTYEEIPDSSYAVDAIGDAEGEESPNGHETKWLYVPDATTSAYTIKVIGTGVGAYTFGVITNESTGDNTTHKEFVSETTPGRVATYRIDLNGTSGDIITPVDHTSPEGVVLFDTATQKLIVTGKDETTVHPTVTLVPIEKHATREEDGDEYKKGTMYRIKDEAGNTTMLSFGKFTQEGKEAHVALEQVAYSTTSRTIFPQNEIQYEWSLEKNGTIKKLEQHVSVKGQADARADYDHKTNQTMLTIGKTSQQFPGLLVIGLETKTGQLILKY